MRAPWPVWRPSVSGYGSPCCGTVRSTAAWASCCSVLPARCGSSQRWCLPCRGNSLGQLPGGRNALTEGVSQLSLIGVLLLAGRVLGLLADAAGPVTVIALPALIAAFSAWFLPEVA